MRVTRRGLRGLYAALHHAYGPQHWWRAKTPFEMMAGAVLVQNTNWSNAVRAIAALKRAKLLTPSKIAMLPLPELARHIRSSGTHRVKAKRLRALAIWMLEQGGVKGAGKLATEELRRSLLSVHGIGPETADCILLYVFDRPTFIADAYARRLLGRLGFELGTDRYESVRSTVEIAFKADTATYNEFHALIVRHSKRVCRATPACERCSVRRRCAYPKSRRATGRRTAPL